MKKLILIFVLGACVEQPIDGDADYSYSPSFAALDGAACTSDCYTVVVRRGEVAAAPLTMVPEPFVAATLNGVAIGRTTTGAAVAYYTNPIPYYQAKWNQAIGVVSMHVGDLMTLQMVDVDGRVLVGCDGFRVQNLPGGPLCINDGSMLVEFIAN